MAKCLLVIVALVLVLALVDEVSAQWGYGPMMYNPYMRHRMMMRHMYGGMGGMGMGGMYGPMMWGR